MKLRVLFLIVFVLLSFGCSHIQKASMAAGGNPYKDDDNFLSLGQVTYAQNCANCHGERGAGDGPDLTTTEIMPPNFTDGSFDKSLGLVAANIKYGKREAMPAFSDKLSEREIWAVAKYVQSLRRT